MKSQKGHPQSSASQSSPHASPAASRPLQPPVGDHAAYVPLEDLPKSASKRWIVGLLAAALLIGSATLIHSRSNSGVEGAAHVSHVQSPAVRELIMSVKALEKATELNEKGGQNSSAMVLAAEKRTERAQAALKNEDSNFTSVLTLCHIPGHDVHFISMVGGVILEHVVTGQPLPEQLDTARQIILANPQLGTVVFKDKILVFDGSGAVVKEIKK